MSTYMRTYHVGDYVDIKVNPAQHKGMPFKAYHGRTGRVFNVSRRAVGVKINKNVNGKIIKKAMHVRVEHVNPSKCRQEVLRRVKENEAAKATARQTGVKVDLKRHPRPPKAGYTYKMKQTPTTMQAQIFVDLV
eukprot:CAMPEP_0182464012 /NCGR_PEP_ID=MMETSP1319-20130603/8174_1 /TAXON_ID=172717 /ORGANISM="Bolidomonas pacifica, Strain RCC208" /LENGTH=133 /DNA_ID=CAMNT_0024663613 /DNA_START=102 /DNA_END=503 /DNA_ORIENTATION=+